MLDEIYTVCTSNISVVRTNYKGVYPHERNLMFICITNDFIMKPAYVLFLIACLLGNCTNKSNHQDTISEPVEKSETLLLKDEVDDVHNEVMRKWNEIYKWKNKLKSLDSTSTLSPEKKQEVNLTIQKLDSAYDNMMDWMHKYKPEEHEAETESDREYFENEMQKIKQVDSDIQDALDKAETVASE